MFSSPRFWVAYAGSFAGVLEVMLLGRAARILGGILGISTGEPKRFTPKRRLWAVPFLVLHPACWGLGGRFVVSVCGALRTCRCVLGLVCRHFLPSDFGNVGTGFLCCLQSKKKAGTCGRPLTFVGVDREG